MKKIFPILLLFVYGYAGAHGLRYTVTGGESVVIRLSYASGSAFSDKAYEVYRAGDSNPYQSGRTDPFGRIVFIPDSSGTWRIRAFSEDGHGLDISIDTTRPVENPDSADAPIDTVEHPPETDKTPVGSGWRIIMALAMIFGVFGVVSIFMRRKR